VVLVHVAVRCNLGGTADLQGAGDGKPERVDHFIVWFTSKNKQEIKIDMRYLQFKYLLIDKIKLNT